MVHPLGMNFMLAHNLYIISPQFYSSGIMFLCDLGPMRTELTQSGMLCIHLFSRKINGTQESHKGRGLATHF